MPKLIVVSVLIVIVSVPPLINVLISVNATEKTPAIGI